MATTASGLPYPVGTDRVMDGDDAIKALAEALTPSAWTVLPLASGILVNAGRTPRLRSYGDGTVEMVGQIVRQGGSDFGTGSMTVATVPAGFLPGGAVDIWTIIIAAATPGAYLRMTVNATTGEIQVAAAPGPTNAAWLIGRWAGGPYYRP